MKLVSMNEDYQSIGYHIYWNYDNYSGEKEADLEVFVIENIECTGASCIIQI